MMEDSVVVWLSRLKRMLIPLQCRHRQRHQYTPMRYFYRWVGSRHSGNPIFFGYPDAPSYDNTLIHYVHPLYDENHVRLVVEKLNSRL